MFLAKIMKKLQVINTSNNSNKQNHNKPTTIEQSKKINNDIYLRISSQEYDKSDSLYAAGFILGYN